MRRVRKSERDSDELLIYFIVNLLHQGCHSYLAMEVDNVNHVDYNMCIVVVDINSGYYSKAKDFIHKCKRETLIALSMVIRLTYLSTRFSLLPAGIL